MKASEIWSAVQAASAALGAALGYFVGGLDGALYTLIAFVAADYVTGVFAGFIRKELSSEVGARGILKNVTMGCAESSAFIIIGVANLADIHLLHDGSALRTATIFFYAANEMVSLIENCAIIGLPVPQVIRNALAQIKRKSGENPDENKKEDNSNE